MNKIFEKNKKMIVCIFIIAIIFCVTLLFNPVRQILINIILKYILSSWVKLEDFWNEELFVLGCSGILLIAAFLYFAFSDTPLKRLDIKNNKIYVGIEFAIIFIFAVVTIAVSMINKAIWYDEACSVAIVNSSWKDMFFKTTTDVHPPLYYCILKANTALFGNSIFVMKMVSLLPSLLTMFCIARFFNKEISYKSAIVFLLCFAASNAFLHYSVEIRMYSWALFFTTMLVIPSWHILKTGKFIWWICFVILFVCAAYTHYYAAFTAGIMFMLLGGYIFIYQRKQSLKVILAAVAIAVLYIPQILVVISQMKYVAESYWVIDAISLRAFEDYAMIVFSNGNIFIAGLYFLLFCGFLIYFIRKKEKNLKDGFAFCCLLSFVLLIVFNILIAIAIKPILQDRYLIPASALIWIFVAIAFEKIKNSRILLMCFFFVCILSCISFTSTLIKENKESVDYDRFSYILNKNTTPDDVFVFSSETFLLWHISGIISALQPGHEHLFLKSAETPSFNVNLFDFSKVKDKGILKNRPVWILFEDCENIENCPLYNENLKYYGIFHWHIYRFKLYKN
jgi:hypothetical protein